MEPATVARLARVGNIAAIKEASGNISQVGEVLHKVPGEFVVLSGEDDMTVPVISLGGKGIISVASNIIPREMAQMTEAALRDDWKTARALHCKYLPLMKANFYESNPMPVKAILAMMGKIEEYYRLPMVPVKAETRTKLRQVAVEVGLLRA